MVSRDFGLNEFGIYYRSFEINDLRGHVVCDIEYGKVFIHLESGWRVRKLDLSIRSLKVLLDECCLGCARPPVSGIELVAGDYDVDWLVKVAYDMEV